MADEPKQPDDIKGILSELDAILSDLGTAAGTPSKPAPAPQKPAEAAKPPAPPAPAPAAPPVSAPRLAGDDAGSEDKTQVLHIKKSAEPLPPPEPEAAAIPLPPITPPPPTAPPAPRPAAPPPAAPPAPRPAAPPPPAPPPAVAPPAPPPAPVPAAVAAPPPAPAAAAVPPPVPAPAVAAAPPPAPAPAAGTPPPATAAASSSATIGGGEVPPATPKEQIRRVAFLYTFACAEARRTFSTYLSQVAKTVSKKPLYLREVLSAEVAGASDPDALYEEAARLKVVAILAIVEGWPPQRVDAMAEACSRAGMLFRSVSPGDVQKKSAAVDIIVDMMLLPGERDG